MLNFLLGISMKNCDDIQYTIKNAVLLQGIELRFWVILRQCNGNVAVGRHLVLWFRKTYSLGGSR